MRHLEAMSHLVEAVQALSQARSFEHIAHVARAAARRITGADGATLVLREGDLCHYVDEDAIGPLWKGQKFPLTGCVSGYVMLNNAAVAIPDIYADPRVPHAAYRPTFVKSLVMVPIRRNNPLGAIGNYWASFRDAPQEDVDRLQALADSTSVAMENVRLLNQLERRVQERTARLQDANDELEAFSYSVSHDLRAPLRATIGFGNILRDRHGAGLGTAGLSLLERIIAAAERMDSLITSLLDLSHVSRGEPQRGVVDMTGMVRELGAELAAAMPGRRVRLEVDDGLLVDGDAALLRAVMQNLLANAWKFTGRSADPLVEVRRVDGPSDMTSFCVRDNGAGFDQAYAHNLFAPFQRLHAATDFPGTGIGLAIVQRVMKRHGGSISAHGVPGQGATFELRLPLKAPGD